MIQMPSIGNMNGQIRLFKRKIVELVEIISIHHDTIEEMNGTVNGYQIKHEMIKDEVKKCVLMFSSINRTVLLAIISVFCLISLNFRFTHLKY